MVMVKNYSRLTFDVSRLKAYSYGDSAGFTPDFPFNPEPSGTKYAANVKGALIPQNFILVKFFTAG